MMQNQQRILLILIVLYVNDISELRKHLYERLQESKTAHVMLLVTPTTITSTPGHEYGWLQ